MVLVLRNGVPQNALTFFLASYCAKASFE